MKWLWSWLKKDGRSAAVLGAYTVATVKGVAWKVKSTQRRRPSGSLPLREMLESGTWAAKRIATPREAVV
jgi:hypothetical protein